MTEPQIGGTYDQILEAALWAERQGMVSFARSDHYYSSREPRPDATDAFATLAGLARETTSIRLTVLVTPITFRHPAVIAKTAATIDQMSGGRLDLGVGTGWMDLEHEVFGLSFPSWKERFERLTEALPYLDAAFNGGAFEGIHYQIEADARPRPAGIRIIVGGSGPTKTPRLAGVHADEYNLFVAPPETIAPKVAVMRDAAREAGRHSSEVTVSVMGPVLTGPDDAAYRLALSGWAAKRDKTETEAEARLAELGIPHGPPDQVAAHMAALEEVGVSRFYLQWLDLDDMEGLASMWAGI